MQLPPVRVCKIVLLMMLLCCCGLTVCGQKEVSALLVKLKNTKRQSGFKTDINSPALLNEIAIKYIYNKPDSALYFAQQGLQLARAQHNPLAQAKAAASVAKIYYVLGYYFPSLDASDEAMAISKKINYRGGVVAAFNIKGLIYLAQDKLDDAIVEFDRAVSVSGQIKDSTQMAANYFDLGLCYDEKHVFDKAFLYLNKAINIAVAINDWHINLMALNRLGETYYHAKNYPAALKYYQAALNFKLYHDNWENSFAYSGIAQTEYALQNYPAAIENAKKSLEFSETMKASWDTERAMQILSDSYAAAHDYQNAFLYQKKVKNYADTLLNEAKEREINYLHLKEKKAENLRLAKQNQASLLVNEANRLVILIISMVTLFLVIVIIVFMKNNGLKNRLNNELHALNADMARQKEEISAQSKELLALNKTKDQVFSVIGHDLRSPFASILQCLELIKYGDLEPGEQELIFDSFNKQVMLVTGMINNLLIWASSQQSGLKTSFENINLTDAVNEIISVSAFFAKSKNLQIIHQATQSVMIEADLNRVKVILQNLLGNAIKFTPKDGTIYIFYTTADDYHIVHIKDTGVGMSPEKMEKLFKVAGKGITDYGTDKEMGTGLGLMMIKQFTEDNGGHMEISSKINEGSEFMVYFKMA